MREDMRRKRLECSSSWLLHRDNTNTHASFKIVQFFTKQHGSHLTPFMLALPSPLGLHLVLKNEIDAEGTLFQHHR